MTDCVCVFVPLLAFGCIFIFAYNFTIFNSGEAIVVLHKMNILFSDVREKKAWVVHG